MVLTGTDPERGRHGEDVHFKEDIAVFMCLCTSESRKKRANMTFYYLSVFGLFVSILYALHVTVYLKPLYVASLQQ